MQPDAEISVIKGVGPAIAERLNLLGIKTIHELIYFLPRRYDDFSRVVPISNLTPGKVTIKAKVESVAGRYVRRRLHITEAVLADSTARLRAVWFNQPYRATQLAKGREYYFSGVYDLQRNRYVLSNPAAEQADNFGVSTARIVPIYRESLGLKSQKVRQVLREILPLISALPETLPPEIIAKYDLASLSSTLQNIHFPKSSEQLEQAKRRLAFEELLWLITASLSLKQRQNQLPGYKIPFKKPHAEQFIEALPFTLTAAQKRSAWEILQDIASGLPMNRLLQGDVGSGKTAVAAMASFLAIRAGYQVAFMAPTEILASQHAEQLAKLLQPLGVNVALLVGSLKPKVRQELKARLKDGEVNLAVGTHALIEGGNEFKKLGLVVIDEQHRFGVRQRQELLAKSPKGMPHLLSMSATPIPRSLQLTVYGELEVSIIDELPAGRQPIETEVVSASARHMVYQKIDKQIKQGRQAYVVCPLVAEGLNAELKSVEAEFERLNKSIFRHRRLGLLHGQLKADQKDMVMQRFKNNEIDILICTTVVEVGVDVPNATVMLIEGADRFGLAQLHQLRGRVGRGHAQSFCYLVPSGQTVASRLRELERSQSGFYLAEADLKLRGPGEIYGRAQHGKLEMAFVNLGDLQLVKQVRTAAEWLLERDLLSKYPKLNAKVDQYLHLTSLN